MVVWKLDWAPIEGGMEVGELKWLMEIELDYLDA